MDSLAGRSVLIVALCGFDVMVVDYAIDLFRQSDQTQAAYASVPLCIQ